MSTFASYRSVNKGCMPSNSKPQSSPTHRDQALRMRQLGKFGNGGQPLPGQLAMAKPLSSFANDPVKSDSLIALGALAAFGAASYGLLRSHWERNAMVQDLNERERKQYLLKERARVNQEREELQRLENTQVFKIVVTGVLLASAVTVLLFKGWFFLLLALLVMFSVMVCTFA